MSVLSHAKMVERILEGNLVVSPVLRPQLKKDGSYGQIGPASIDLRLGTVAALVRGSYLSHVDLQAYAEAEKAEPYEIEKPRRRNLERLTIPFGLRLMVHAGGVVLASTLEWVKLPNDLVGVVTARSSWAREGLSIATATFINPCYNGIITLELSNLGQIPLELYPGLRIAQIAFFTIDDDKLPECTKRSGQFDLAFEPQSGKLTSSDEMFIPTRKKSVATPEPAGQQTTGENL